jgi:hypothetical protein
MMRASAIIAAVAVLAACSPTAVAAQSADSGTGLPVTGLDFSGIDEFWKIVDLLAHDVEPSERDWQSLLTTPGYRLAIRSAGGMIRQDLSIAVRPSRARELSALAQRNDDRAARLKHLVRALTYRQELVAFRESLSRAAPVAEGMRLAQRYLPPGATSVGEPPLVAFALFRSDAYSQPAGIVMDLLNALDKGVNPMLGHELHHAYLRRLAPVARTTAAKDADTTIAGALTQLRNEGLADLVDKPYPLTPRGEGSAAYTARYNEEYARTPSTLRSVDSALAATAADSSQYAAAGDRLRALLWSSGHASGAYMARAIYETFGVDSLYPAAYNPASFLWTYAAAERARGRPLPWSPSTLRAIAKLDERYWAGAVGATRSSSRAADGAP